MSTFTIHPLTIHDSDWITQFLARHWGSPILVSHDVIYEANKLPGLVAVDEQRERVGLLTYQVQGDECEVVSLNSTRPVEGIGTALIEAVKVVARENNCRRLWLITTNDNMNALRFYQKRGFILVAVHRCAVERAREIKPIIPLIGNDGIPIRDEIELEWLINR